ncbi:MAG: hypothetical protein KAT05_03600, partial [Spirochaetes bacterium]|nr:hypothetical protein [Spirochaetota bacterium]
MKNFNILISCTLLIFLIGSSVALASTPFPVANSDVSSFSLDEGQTKKITFNVKNWGSDSTTDSYLSISTSSGLEIIDYYSSSSSMRFGNNPPGSLIWTSSGGQIRSSYQLLDAYKSYPAGSSATVTITVRAKIAGSQWIKYRTAFSDGNTYYRTPSSGGRDEQGWYVDIINANVNKPKPPSSSVSPSVSSFSLDK